MDLDFDVENLTEEQITEMIAKAEKGEAIVEPEKKEQPVIEEPEEKQEPQPKEEPIEKEEEAEEKDVFDKKHSPEEGIKREMFKERERRRQAEAKLKELEEKIAQANKTAIEPQKVVEKDKFSEYEDDDVVSIKLLKEQAEEIKLLKEKMSYQEKEAQLKRERQAVEIQRKTEKEIREKYSEASVGAEYSYDTILVEEIEPLLQSEPYIADVIRNSKNPAETAYRIGLSRRLDLEKIKKPIEKAVSLPKTPKTVGSIASSGGHSGELSIEGLDESKISDLKEEDLLRLIKKLETKK